MHQPATDEQRIDEDNKERESRQKDNETKRKREKAQRAMIGSKECMPRCGKPPRKNKQK